MVTKCLDEWVPNGGSGARSTAYDHTRCPCSEAASDQNESVLRCNGIGRETRRAQGLLWLVSAARDPAESRVADAWEQMVSRGDA